MFEELCRDSGKVKIPTGTFVDNVEEVAEADCTYFIMSDSYRDNEGALQCDDFYMVKGLGAYKLTADCVFVDKDGVEYNLQTVQRIDNLFENVHEFYKLGVVK